MQPHKIIVSLLIASSLVACSSTKENHAKDDIRTAQIYADAEKARQLEKQRSMEAALASVPEWTFNIPKPDSVGIYGYGTAESDKLASSQDQAMLRAEFNLAKLYNQELSGSERMYSRSDNGGSGSEQYVALIDKLVQQVSVVGYETVKRDSKVINGRYHTFILLKLPYAQFNQVLQEQKSKTSNPVIIAEFKDLERRLKAKRIQVKEEQAADMGETKALPPTNDKPVSTNETKTE